jgi:multicomponent Na+:H+ antiporter subunit E
MTQSGGTGWKPVEIILHSAALWALWTILSGKLDFFHISIGLACSLGVALWTHELCYVDRDGARVHMVWLPWGRILAYTPWLLWQIVLSSVQVARVVLRPSLPIKPRLIRFRVDLPGEVAHLMLANSITLTPGTVTVDRDGSEYLIHALTDEATESLLAGEMQKKVAKVFRSELREPAS